MSAFPLSGESASIGQLLLRVCAEALGMLHDSLRLAAAEARGRLKEVGALLVLAATGTAILMVAVAALAAGAIIGLGTVMPLWCAALVVAGAALISAGILARLAWGRLRSLGRPPEHTLRALDEGASWLRARSHP